MNRPALIAIAIATLASPALAQSNISPINKYAWGENIGFLNFRDANAAASGCSVRFSSLTGWVWAENAGWIHLGNGVDPGPGACFLYPAAQSGATFGVNLDGGSGDPGLARLTGFAWGENVGWINFNTSHPSRPRTEWARYDRTLKRFTGYAWGENIGWVNLNNASIFVSSTLCRADADGNGTCQPADVAFFINTWSCSLTAGVQAGDIDGNGLVEPADVALFIQWWLACVNGGGAC